VKCRKNVKHLTADEKTRFVNAFLALKSQNSVIHPGTQSRYDDFVETHLNAMWDSGTNQMRMLSWGHGDSVFLPWHRELLYQFEKLLQSVDPSVTIPYWDWTRDQGSADPGFPFKHPFIGVDGDDADSDRVKREPGAPSPYPYAFDPEAWSTTITVVDPMDSLNFFQRQFGEFNGAGTANDAPNLPQNDVVVTGTLTTFRAAIGAGDYFTLRTRSEDLHNLVHRWTGGNMLRMTSPNDPVFFMHHAQIDRMWSIWQKKVAPGTALFQQSSSAAGHKLNDAMIYNDVNPAPFATGTTVAQVIDGHTMHGTGVWYESDLPELSNETGGTLAFTNVPEGLTSYKAVRFKIKGCRPVHFRITGAPTGQFGLVTMNGLMNVTEFVANPDESADFFYGYVWVKLAAVAGPIASSSVDIHAYIVDEEGYYAATEGGEYPLGDFHVELQATTVPRTNNSVALILDRSGSMADPAGGTSTKSDLLRSAIQVFRTLMLADDEIAVVSFDDVVDTPVPIQDVSTAPDFTTIDLTPRNSTWIGGGVRQGAVQLAAATHTNRSMVVLTDGNENVHPHVDELGPGVLTNRTYAIGFGLPGTVTDGPLHTITSNTHGDLIITGNISTDEQRFNLTKYFVQILAGVTNMNVLLDPQGALFKGSKHTIPIQLSDADVYADVIVLCPIPQLLDFELRTPGGEVITPADAGAEPNVSFAIGDEVAFYRLVLPASAADPDGSHAGTWQAVLALKSVPELKKLGDSKAVIEAVRRSAVRESLPYSFIAHAYSNLSFRATKRQESLEPGSLVHLFAALTEYDVPLRTDATVWVEVTPPDGPAFDLSLDRVDAGLYSAVFSTSLAGVYTCRVRAEGLTSMSSPFVREQTLTAGVYEGDHTTRPGTPDTPAGSFDAACRLLKCLLSEGALAEERLAELGVDVERLTRCIELACAVDRPERIEGLTHVAFEAIRREPAKGKPAIAFKRARAAKKLKPEITPAPAPEAEPEAPFPTMFTSILAEGDDEMNGKMKHSKS
jgi:Common central domain of tyrosinase